MNERFEAIKGYLEGKTVLDVGCCGKTIYEKKPDLVHFKISEVAKSVKGLDNRKECVKRFKEFGYDVTVGDACNFNMNEKYDAIFAGELLEHIPNPGNFLVCAKRHLKRGGKIIITAPNGFYIGNIILILLKRMPDVDKEHVIMFDEFTLRNLLKMHGFETEKVEYVSEFKTEIKHTSIKKVFVKLLQPLLPIRLRHKHICVIGRIEK